MPSGATLTKSAVVRCKRLLERGPGVGLGKLRQRPCISSVAQSRASIIDLTRTEQRCARGPGGTVARRRVSPKLRAEGDQLGQVRDRLDAPDIRNPDEPVRVEVVAEQERRVFVNGVEEAWVPVMNEVALVDRLEPERVALLAQRREDRLAFGLQPQGVVPERALSLRLDRDRLPEINRRSLQPPAPSSRSPLRRVQWR